MFFIIPTIFPSGWLKILVIVPMFSDIDSNNTSPIFNFIRKISIRYILITSLNKIFYYTYFYLIDGGNSNCIIFLERYIDGGLYFNVSHVSNNDLW